MTSRRATAALREFHPLVRTWFTETFGAPSDPQRKGWPAIGSGAHTLILAPTGTGKTLAAFLCMRPLPNRPRTDIDDPARWLPGTYAPSAGRKVVQRRTSVRRLPRWRRPDRGTSVSGWIGRWSLVSTPGTLGVEPAPEEHAATIARQWLERYGIVARNWWRRERPPVPWRDIYFELKRMEFRGEVRRGYFVRGLAGAQFALPDALEQLRVPNADAGAPFVTIAAGDPANVYGLELEGVDLDPLARPRGCGALLVMRDGRVALSVEGRGRRITVASWMTDVDVTAAAVALLAHLRAAGSHGGARETWRSRRSMAPTPWRRGGRRRS